MGKVGQWGQWVLLHMGASISGALLRDPVTVDRDHRGRGVAQLAEY